jgi:alkylated DNA repair dioxygenase AlkB
MMAASTQIEMTAPSTAPDAQNLRMAEEQGRLKGFLGTADEMTQVAAVVAPKTVEWVRSLTDAEIIPLGVKALGDIADDILVLDEIRQRFRRGRAIEGYTNWTEFVEKNSKYGIRTIQKRLNTVHGVRGYEKFEPFAETNPVRLSTETQEPEPTATPANGISLYDPNFLSKEDADRLFAAFEKLPWERKKIQFYGLKPAPNSQVWMGTPPQDGAYSSSFKTIVEWTPEALEIRQRVYKVTGFLFDSLNFTRYQDENEHCGWHVDKADEGLWDFPIASVSLGAEREFQTQRYESIDPTKRHKRTPVGEPHTLSLAHGSLVVMPAGSQAEYMHRLKKTSQSCGPRINLTFRMMTPAVEATVATAAPAVEDDAITDAMNFPAEPTATPAIEPVEETPEPAPMPVRRLKPTVPHALATMAEAKGVRVSPSAKDGRFDLLFLTEAQVKKAMESL